MRYPELVDYFHLPARDREQPRPVVVPVTRWQQWRAAAVRRGRSRRRLAYLDNTFPWMRSGFRYHEALALHELAPDTLFFSMWDLEDPFPAPVHSIAQFPRIAAAAGITDAYGVFSMFLEGLAGTLGEFAPEDVDHAFAGPDVSRVLAQLDINLHGTIYPGGGFFPTDDGYARLHALAARMQTMMSYVPEVLDHVPETVAIDQALTETRFYSSSSERWSRPEPVVCLFAADAPPRKGLDLVLEVFADLDPSRFHLHVVGPHQHHHEELPPEIADFHGWLAPEDLRALHRHVHVFVSPVRAEDPGPPGSRQGTTDGFPTQAASDAMSSGCLLISANPSGDHRVLTPDVHYLERARDVRLWRETLVTVAGDLDRARTLAQAGSARVHERMDILAGTARKLELMGIERR